MDLVKQTKRLCKTYNIKPSRSKGQNFLVNNEVYNKVVEIVDLKKDDIVLEVGPGLGFLTEKLAKKVKKVIAVELDDKLVRALKERLEEREIKNVEVVNEDILKISNFQFLISNKMSNVKCKMSKSYKIVANLPYNITSIFLRKFLSAGEKPSLMVLMLQKEVAERIIASPPKMSKLAVSVQFYSLPEIIENVPASNFWPEPGVDSAIIKLKTTCPQYLCKRGRRENEKLKINEKEFFRLVRIGFSARRKMLKNNLAAGCQTEMKEVENWLKKAKFNLKVRAQELSVKDWLKLFGEINRNML